MRRQLLHPLAVVLRRVRRRPVLAEIDRQHLQMWTRCCDAAVVGTVRDWLADPLSALTAQD